MAQGHSFVNLLSLNNPKSNQRKRIMTPHAPNQRVFLFLQGPHGPFFNRLGKMLRTAGADVWRVGFNAGARAFWFHPRTYIPYRGTTDAWPDTFKSLLDEKSVTDIVLYGDTRPIHASAVAKARARGLTVHVFEEGYMRPYWVTYERGGTEGAPATLEEVQVDGAGFIFIPYAGRIKAAGNSPEAIRRIITNKLADQTPDPQVEVRRAAGDGSTVSLVGAVGGQGVYPIERPTRSLATMLARSGGITISPEIAQITVIRGQQRGKIWFEDLYEHPELDIALRGGDKIPVEQDTRSFTALGATGSQARVAFETQNLSAIEAIAQVGGLLAASADPTGVFVLRNEPEEVAKQVLGRNDLEGTQRMVYVLNLTEPNGMFMARDFVIRDGDTLYSMSPKRRSHSGAKSLQPSQARPVRQQVSRP